MTREVSVDVVSDVMCPWCYIGKRHLEAAQAQLAEDDIGITVRWRPYQLDPTIPPEGRDRQEYLTQKFGSAERAASLYRSIQNAGANVGLDFQFDRIAKSPNTIDAHRIIRWSASAGVQGVLVEKLFEAFFLKGHDLTDRTTLVELASDSGMEGSIVADLLASDRDRDEVEQEIAQARALGVTGVPCFIVDGRQAVMGAQPPETLAALVRSAT